MADSKKHTPGPWHVDPKAAEESFFEDVSILRHDGLAVAVAVHNGDIIPPEPEANARLIAAAPDLLEALKPFAECCDSIGREIPDSKDTSSWTFQAGDFRRARAAIAKAEGRS